MPDEEHWYFAKGGVSNGPMSQHSLCQQYQAGKFSAEDYVYCKELTDGWVKASSVPGLCDSLELEPEPEPEHHQVPLYEKASYAGAVGEHNLKKAQKEREKKFWSRLKAKK